MPRLSRGRRLGLEPLEERRVLSGATSVPAPPVPASPGMGINLDLLNDWDAELLFANAMMTARHWGSTTTPWDEAAPEDALGWPTQDAGVVVTDPTGGDVGGTYALSFTGQAASITGVATHLTVEDQVYNADANTTTATIVVQPGQDTLDLSFTGTQRLPTDSLAANPNGTGITNISLMRPTVTDGNTPYAPTTLFTTPIENLIGNFQVIRFMDYSATNGNTQVNWSDRTLPAAATQAAANGGAWEYAVALANATDKDMWINIPEGATPEYVTDLADLIKYGSDGVNPYTSPQANPVYAPLNANLKVYVEYSNEVWNFSFPQATQNQAAAVAEAAAGNSPLNYDGSTDPFTLAVRRVVEQTVDDSNIFRSVFSDAAMMNQIRPVYEWQYDDLSDTAETGLEFLDNYYNDAGGQQYVAAPHPPDYYLWGGGGAWYSDVNDDSGDGDVTVQNGSFESPVVSDVSADPAGSGWIFAGSAGIAVNGSSLGNPAAPQANQAAYLQGTGSFSQAVTFSGGYADISLSMAQAGAGSESFEVLYDGTPIGSSSVTNSFTPTASYQTTLTIPLMTTAGTHTLTFLGTGGSGAAVIDNVQVQTVNGMYDSGLQSISSLVTVEDAWATAYGLQMTSYEGGFHMGGDNPTPLQMIANLDPRAQQDEAASINQFFQDGGGLAVYFNTTGGAYELTDDLDDLNTPKLLAIYAASAAGFPSATLGTLLPSAVGQQVALPEPSSTDYSLGSMTNAAIELVQATAPGTFSLQFQGEQSANSAESVEINGQAMAATVTFPVGQPGYSNAVTFSITAPGLYAISLLSDGTNYVGLSGNAQITSLPADANLVSTSLTSSLNPPTLGQSTTFTATVAPASGAAETPTGAVTFMDGATVLGTGALSVINGVEQASVTLPSLTIGDHSITALYGGDGNFTTGASAPLELPVLQSTITSLASSANPAIYGQPTTFTATIAAAAAGSVVPLGNVTFWDGGNILGIESLTLVNGVDQATLTTGSLALGSHQITAVYAGEAFSAASTSAVLAQTITNVATTTSVVSNLGLIGLGQGLTFTATVAAPSGDSGTPTGMVTFYDGAAALGNGVLTLVNGVDQVTLITSDLAAGSHSITAVYGGDTNYLGSTSPGLTQTVSANITVTMIDFEGLDVTGETLPEPFMLNGFDFTSTGNTAGNALMLQGTTGLTWPGNWSSNVLMAAYWGTVQNITSAGGGPFNVDSLDLDVNYQTSSAMIMGYDASGNMMQQQIVNFTGNDSQNVSVTEALGWTGVSQVTVSWWESPNGTGGGRFGAIDNLLLTQNVNGVTTISQTAPTIVVTEGNGPYTGLPFTATTTSIEGNTPSLTYYSGTSYSGTSAVGSALSGAPSLAGTYTVLASFSGSTDYLSGAASTVFTISQAAPAIAVVFGGSSFTGLPFTATAPSIEGTTPSLSYYSGISAAGATLNSAPSTAGTYTLLASFSGSTDYAPGMSSTVFTISQAEPTISVAVGNGPYTGLPFTGTTSSIEGNMPSLSYYSGASAFGVPLSSTPSTAGTYTALASFSGSTDYVSGIATATFTIGLATPSVSVTGHSGTFTGSSYSASDNVAGVGSQSSAAASLESVVPKLAYYSGTSIQGAALSGAPSAAGTYAVLASFSGSSDYGSASAIATFAISRMAPTVTVTDNGGIYDKAAYSAKASVAGVGNQSAASLEKIVPSLIYYSGTQATGSILPGAPTTVGTYTVLASFAGSADYLSAAASTTFSITKATATLTVADSSGNYTAAAYAATDKVNATSSLEGVTPTLTYDAGTSATGTTLSGAPTTVGTYTVLASFAGSTDYFSAVASTTFSIAKATATLTVTDSSGNYTGSAYAATDKVKGGANLEGVTPTLSYYSGTVATGTALSGPPTTVGTYTVLASFAGSTDYVSSAANATFSIAKAAPTITVTDHGGVYTGSPYAATVIVNGGSSLEGVKPTLTYYSGAVATGTALSGIPSTVGTYTVLSSFAGSADYKNGPASITFTISRSTTTTTVTSSLTPAVVGQAITLTATVAPASGAGSPTGTVTFYAGSTVLGMGTLKLVGGVAEATLTVSSLAAGSYSIKAVYSDDANFAASTSAALVQVISSSATTNGRSNLTKLMLELLGDL